MSDAVLAEHRVPGGAPAAVVGALALAVTNALVALQPPPGSTADLVRQVGEAPLLTEVVVATGLLAAVLLVPGTWAVAQRLAPRAPRAAAVGAWLTASAYVLSTALSVETATALAVARAGGSGSGSGDGVAAYAAAADAHAPVVVGLLYAAFGLGALVGVVVLGVAALRQGGAVPRWAGWALVLSAPVRVAGLALGVAAGPPVASLLLAVGFAGVLVTVVADESRVRRRSWWHHHTV